MDDHGPIPAAPSTRTRKYSISKSLAVLDRLRYRSTILEEAKRTAWGDEMEGLIAHLDTEFQFVARIEGKIGSTRTDEGAILLFPLRGRRFATSLASAAETAFRGETVVTIVAIFPDKPRWRKHVTQREAEVRFSPDSMTV